MDEMVIKRKDDSGFLSDVEKTLMQLKHANMKLNPKKCIFWVKKGKFPGHIVTTLGIEVVNKNSKVY